MANKIAYHNNYSQMLDYERDLIQNICAINKEAQDMIILRGKPESAFYKHTLNIDQVYIQIDDPSCYIYKSEI